MDIEDAQAMSDDPSDIAVPLPSVTQIINPTPTAPTGYYNNNYVPNPPTDSGTIPGFAIALLGVSALLIFTKKK